MKIIFGWFCLVKVLWTERCRCFVSSNGVSVQLQLVTIAFVVWCNAAKGGFVGRRWISCTANSQPLAWSARIATSPKSKDTLDTLKISHIQAPSNTASTLNSWRKLGLWSSHVELRLKANFSSSNIYFWFVLFFYILFCVVCTYNSSNLDWPNIAQTQVRFEISADFDHHFLNHLNKQTSKQSTNKLWQKVISWQIWVSYRKQKRIKNKNTYWLLSYRSSWFVQRRRPYLIVQVTMKKREKTLFICSRKIG